LAAGKFFAFGGVLPHAARRTDAPASLESVFFLSIRRLTYSAVSRRASVVMPFDLIFLVFSNF
jgi:hypothetical protein